MVHVKGLCCITLKGKGQGASVTGEIRCEVIEFGFKVRLG